MAVLKGILVLLVVAAAGAVLLFAGFAFETFSLKSRDVKADAVVVLTGGRGRVEEGLRLYRKGAGKLLLLSGVDPAVRKGDLFRERPGEEIIMESNSTNTLENALYARSIIVRKNISSIVLITSRYHMKRSVLMFRNLLPKDVVIYAHPVDTRNLKEEWWTDRGSFRLLFTEFYKYYLYRLFFLVSPGEVRPAATGGYS